MILDEELYEEEKAERLSNAQILRKIWLKPSVVFNSTKDHPISNGMLLGILGLVFVSAVIKSVESYFLYINFTQGPSMFESTLIIGLFTSVLVYVIASLCNWIAGLILKGKASFMQVLKASVLAMLPFIVYDLLRSFVELVIQLSKTPEDRGSFTMINEYGYTNNAVVSMFFGFLIALWGFILLVIALKHYQRFSAGKAIVNVILGIVVLIIPFALMFVLTDMYNIF